jgi:hypothetical protein
LFGPAALIPRLAALLAVVAKPQVFGLSLIRLNLAKSPNDSIRRKFSIDAGMAWSSRIRGVYLFETIPDRFRKPDVHHPGRMELVARAKTPAAVRSFAGSSNALAFA